MYLTKLAQAYAGSTDSSRHRNMSEAAQNILECLTQLYKPPGLL
jgi:hypothetical protein